MDSRLNERLKELGARVTHQQIYEVVKITCALNSRDKVGQAIRETGYRREHGWAMKDGTYCISAKRDIKQAEVGNGGEIENTG